MVKTPPPPSYRRVSVSLLTLGIAKVLKWKTLLSFQSLSGEERLLCRCLQVSVAKLILDIQNTLLQKGHGTGETLTSSDGWLQFSISCEQRLDLCCRQAKLLGPPGSISAPSRNPTSC